MDQESRIFCTVRQTCIISKGETAFILILFLCNLYLNCTNQVSLSYSVNSRTSLHNVFYTKTHQQWSHNENCTQQLYNYILNLMQQAMDTIKAQIYYVQCEPISI